MIGSNPRTSVARTMAFDVTTEGRASPSSSKVLFDKSSAHF